MMIGVSGFGETGSSAASDYLSEFTNVRVLDNIEFTWVNGIDGLVDLERCLFQPHARTGDSSVALRRYVERAKKNRGYYCGNGRIDEKVYESSVKNFIDSITQISWPSLVIKNESFFELLRDRVCRRITVPIEKKYGTYITGYPYRMRGFSVMPENFYDAARQHVKELLTSFAGDDIDDGRDLVLDQPFSGNNPFPAFKFFDDPRAIVVDRDPRDLYVWSKIILKGRHFMPTQNVSDYITYYRKLRDNQPYKQPDERVLVIRFEDMVYEYEKTTKKIRDFLGYEENPNPKTVFIPENSIANTQVYKRYPQYQEDIKMIEDNLREYLFDFEEYDEPQNTKMFLRVQK